MQHFRIPFCAIFLLLMIVACSSGTGSTPVKTGSLNPEPGDQAPPGKSIYKQYCIACHGADGKLGMNGAGDLTRSTLTIDQRETQIAKGKNMMAAYEEILTAEEIKAVAKYTLTLKK